MTADQAIAHPFLSLADAPIEQGLPDDSDEAIRRCREYIWDEIHFLLGMANEETLSSLRRLSRCSDG